MENQSGEKRGRGSAGAGTLRIPKRRSPPAHNSGGRGPPPAGGGYPRDFRGRGGYGGGPPPSYRGGGGGGGDYRGGPPHGRAGYDDRYGPQGPRGGAPPPQRNYRPPPRGGEYSDPDSDSDDTRRAKKKARRANETEEEKAKRKAHKKARKKKREEKRKAVAITMAQQQTQMQNLGLLAPGGVGLAGAAGGASLFGAAPTSAAALMQMMQQQPAGGMAPANRYPASAAWLCPCGWRNVARNWRACGGKPGYGCGQPKPVNATPLPSDAEARAGVVHGVHPAVAGGVPNFVPATSGDPSTHHARILYVGSIERGTSDAELVAFFNSAIAAATVPSVDPAAAAAAAAQAAAGPPVLRMIRKSSSWNGNPVELNNFGFIEFRSMEVASSVAMYLNGVLCRGRPLKIGRPKNYDPSACAAEGPTPVINPLLLATNATYQAMAFPAGSVEARAAATVAYGQIGGGSGANVAYGQIGAGGAAGAAAGIAAATSEFVALAHGGATGSAPSSAAHAAAAAAAAAALVGAAPSPHERQTPTCVLSLSEMVTHDSDDLKNNEMYEELIEDVEMTCASFGTVVSVVIPRGSHAQLPGTTGTAPLTEPDLPRRYGLPTPLSFSSGATPPRRLLLSGHSGKWATKMGVYEWNEEESLGNKSGVYTLIPESSPTAGPQHLYNCTDGKFCVSGTAKMKVRCVCVPLSPSSSPYYLCTSTSAPLTLVGRTADPSALTLLFPSL